MKKVFTWMLIVAMVFTMAACQNVAANTDQPSGQPSEQQSAEQPSEQPSADTQTTEPATGGTDAVEAEAAGSGEYDPTYTITLKVTGPEDDVLYDGTVALKSPTMFASEFLKAAITDKGLAQDGIDVGFVTTLGDYVNDSEKELYWLYTVNGNDPPVGCNQLQMRDGDVMEWYYGAWETHTAEPVTGDWAFEVGSDKVETELAGAGEYDPTITVNMMIVGADNTVLFNGTVTLKSAMMWCSDFTKAAVTDKGLAQDGIDVGFVTTIGDYVNDSENNLYWLYSVNGQSPMFGCNAYQLRNGDYVVWSYGTPDM
jgi:hypothetical protein